MKAENLMYQVSEPSGMPWKWCIVFPEEFNEFDGILCWCKDTFGQPSEVMFYATDDQKWYDASGYNEIYLKSDDELNQFKIKYDQC